ncbi:hypothetical protein BDV27DRAFT_55415 [Aspergillus caelatus]|uniref:Uncharacterized protein n=2 Tax=Aspergillus subgen. Circumdati TaxID=2720871 RepID=A0A5N6ZP08_9EURO|nr:uncharacterized protein BDV27DRAFT_55415 [Aspergillus caelatus]KAE8359347.1 hypothetical protein BDV27DRAFT_55415 [Aspergillus caelatus]KAE8413490.1 hypothetical protein BDV36DRAFT_34793 [Aspergillus pseudocaelatus]
MKISGIAACCLPPELILSCIARVMSVSQLNSRCNIYGSIPGPVLDASLNVMLLRSLLHGTSWQILGNLIGKACCTFKEVISPQR